MPIIVIAISIEITEITLYNSPQFHVTIIGEYYYIDPAYACCTNGALGNKSVPSNHFIDYILITCSATKHTIWRSMPTILVR